jgi:hypothetical protein
MLSAHAESGAPPPGCDVPQRKLVAEEEGFELLCSTSNLQVADSKFGHKGQNSQKGTPWAQFGHTAETEAPVFVLCIAEPSRSFERPAVGTRWAGKDISGREVLRRRGARPKMDDALRSLLEMRRRCGGFIFSSHGRHAASQGQK